MGYRNIKSEKKIVTHIVDNHIEVFIERLRKIRALNGDPSLFGMDNYIVKRMQFNKSNIYTR